MKRKILFVLQLVLLLLCFPFQTGLEAQTAPVVVPRGQTFNIEFVSRYPNDAVMRFSAFVDNVQTKVYSSTELTATAHTPVTDCGATATTCFLYRGVHPSLNNTGTRSLAVRVTEVASGLNSAFSPAVSFIVGTVPDAPGNLRIVVVSTQAGVTFEFKSAPVTVAPSSQAMTTVRIPK